jgi:hypothetical protein
MLKREERRLQNGWTYEPPTFYETNSNLGPQSAVRVVGVTNNTASADQSSPVSAEEEQLLEIGAEA